MDDNEYPRIVWTLDFVWGDTRYVINFIEQKRGDVAWATGFLLFSVGCLIATLGVATAKMAALL